MISMKIICRLIYYGKLYRWITCLEKIVLEGRISIFYIAENSLDLSIKNYVVKYKNLSLFFKNWKKIFGYWQMI